MKKTQIALLSGAAAALFSGIPLAFSFDWPQTETASDSFYSYFGQLRGGRIENSLIFRDSSDVKATEDGTVIAVIHEHNNDFGWFESTLGNAVIVAHDDSLVTVYGNLDGDSIPAALEEQAEISEGTPLGTSGNSGWQAGESCLEFQVLDVQNKAVVNPRILMPRIGKELTLTIGDLSLDDRNGNTHYLINERNLPSGTYHLYRARQEVAVPYRSIVSVNGAMVESMSFDALHESNGRLCVSGNANYPVTSLYPDGKRQLLSVITFTKGHGTLTVTLADILGQTRTITYNLEIN